MLGSNEAGVAPPVISFLSSSRVYPTASLAATLAIGKPVALDARAEERETRGFISITSMRPSSGLTANCTFEPPVSTPISRSTAIAASRMIWYSLSVRVCAGATVMESPVCTPIGSTFSVAHDLHLEFLPADHRFLDQQLVRRRRLQPAFADRHELLAVVGDAAARPPEGERGPDHGRETDRRLNLQRLFQRMRERRARASKSYPRHGLLEFFAVLGLVDRLAARADHFDPVLLQNAVPNEVQRAVESGLAAHGRQQRIGSLPGYDGLQHLPVHS